MTTAPLTDAGTVDACVRTYEDARRAGRSARVADHLPPADDPAHPAALAELVRVDLEFAWADGRPRRVADYLAEFPRLADRPDLLAGVCFEEFRQRADRGERPDPAEYARRYAVSVGGWGRAGGPRTAAVSVTPLPGGGSADELAAAARAYLQFRGGAASAPAGSSFGPPAGGPGARLFAELHASAPEAAGRLAAGVAAFPEVGGEFAGFRLVDELGRGAFARVYLARQGDLAGRPVALKVSAQFAGEAQTLAQLQHTNIVPVYSVHRHGPLAAVCMPYFGATTLADVVGGLRAASAAGGLPRSGRHIVSTLNHRRSVTRAASREADLTLTPASRDVADPAPPPANAPAPVVRTAPPAPAVAESLARLAGYSYVDAVLWLLARLADGLDHAHTRGVVHRDLKPANVLLTDGGQPMLLDFNLAADDNLPGAAAAARVGGTLPYMAPEHLRAFAGGCEAVDARSDLYSLGLIAFELLAGRPAFPTPAAGPLAELLPAMTAQRAGPPPRLRPLNPAVTPAAESVVRTLLHPDPARRYPSAAALKDDLDRHLADRPLRHAPDPSRRERLQKWGRRHPRLSSAGAVGGLAAAALVAAGVTAWGLNRELAAADARAALQQFRAEKERHETTLAAGLADPAGLPARIDAARGTLGRYAVLTDPGWERRADVRLLSAADRERLRRDAGELTALLARAAALPAAGVAPAEAAALGGRAAELAPPDPADPLAAHLRAVELIAQKRYAEAVAPAKRAATGDPDKAAAWFALGRAYQGINAVARAEAAYDVALALVQRDRGEDDYWLRYNRGLVRARARDFAGARDDFDACVALDPARPNAYLDRALARRDLGDPAGAVADLTAALDAGAPETRLYLLRAELRRMVKDESGAAADLATGLRLTPADPVSWVARGLARREADPAGAVADYDHALALDPGYLPALQNKSSVLAEELGRTADAVEPLTQLLKTDPRSVLALSGRAVLYARLGDRAKAVADAEAVLAVTRDPLTVYQVAGVYALTSARHPADKAEALRLLTEALSGGAGFEHLADDPDLRPLRGDPDFERVAAAARRLRPAAR